MKKIILMLVPLFIMAPIHAELNGGSFLNIVKKHPVISVAAAFSALICWKSREVEHVPPLYAKRGRIEREHEMLKKIKAELREKHGKFSRFKNFTPQQLVALDQLKEVPPALKISLSMAAWEYNCAFDDLKNKPNEGLEPAFRARYKTTKASLTQCIDYLSRLYKKTPGHCMHCIRRDVGLAGLAGCALAALYNRLRGA